MHDQPFTIRPATGADRNDVINLFRQYGFDEAILGDWSDHCIRQDKTTMFLAVIENRAVAFGRVGIAENGHGHMYDLYTDPAYRRQGISQAMMQICEEWARHRQAQILELTIYEENHRAQDLYKKRGYVFAFNDASSARASQPPEFHHCMIKHLNGPT